MNKEFIGQKRASEMSIDNLNNNNISEEQQSMFNSFFYITNSEDEDEDDNNKHQRNIDEFILIQNKLLTKENMIKYFDKKICEEKDKEKILFTTIDKNNLITYLEKYSQYINEFKFFLSSVNQIIIEKEKEEKDFCCIKIIKNSKEDNTNKKEMINHIKKRNYLNKEINNNFCNNNNKKENSNIKKEKTVDDIDINDKEELNDINTNINKNENINDISFDSESYIKKKLNELYHDITEKKEDNNCPLRKIDFPDNNKENEVKVKKNLGNNLSKIILLNAKIDIKYSDIITRKIIDCLKKETKLYNEIKKSFEGYDEQKIFENKYPLSHRFLQPFCEKYDIILLIYCGYKFTNCQIININGHNKIQCILKKSKENYFYYKPLFKSDGIIEAKKDLHEQMKKLILNELNNN